MQIKNIILSLLTKSFGVNLICDNVISSIQGKDTLNLIETSSINEIHVKNAILILKNNAKINSIKFIDKSTNVIINSYDTKNLSKLSKPLNHVYTCGFSSKDFVTFSSRNAESAVVSLQREIIKLNGEICEPLDIMCKNTQGISDYHLLAATVCMLLINEINEISPTITFL